MKIDQTTGRFVRKLWLEIRNQKEQIPEPLMIHVSARIVHIPAKLNDDGAMVPGYTAAAKGVTYKRNGRIKLGKSERRIYKLVRRLQREEAAKVQ